MLTHPSSLETSNQPVPVKKATTNDSDVGKDKKRVEKRPRKDNAIEKSAPDTKMWVDITTAHHDFVMDG